MANKPADGVELDVKSTAQLDLEARQARERGEPEPQVGEARSFQVEGNDTSGYVGVSPEYMGYADDTHKPLRSEDGPEKVLEDRLLEAAPPAPGEGKSESKSESKSEASSGAKE